MNLRSIALLAVTLYSTSLAAAPRVPPTGIASLYARTISGSFIFFCSGALVYDERILTNEKVLMSAGHCATFLIDRTGRRDGYTRLPVYASFDDGGSFERIKPMLVGDPAQGYDVSLWRPFDEDKPFVRPAYSISKRETVKAGDEVSNWGFPAGLGLTYSEGYVSQPSAPRPIRGTEINWSGYIAVDINGTGGDSGSALFDAAGEIVGVWAGGFSDDRAFRLSYFMPVGRLFDLL